MWPNILREQSTSEIIGVLAGHLYIDAALFCWVGIIVCVSG